MRALKTLFVPTSTREQERRVANTSRREAIFRCTLELTLAKNPTFADIQDAKRVSQLLEIGMTMREGTLLTNLTRAQAVPSGITDGIS